jgi:hypothetical protein
MSAQSTDGIASKSQPPGGFPWTTGRVVGVLVSLVAMVYLILCVFYAFDQMKGSTVLTVITTLMFVIGITSGASAAEFRKKGMLPKAITAYRIAMWFFFFTLVAFQNFHQQQRREDTEAKQKVLEKSSHLHSSN